jgi:hypothetical protein
VNLKPHNTTSLTQDHEQDQEDKQEETQDVDQVHDQEERIDQGGDKDDGDQEQGQHTQECTKPFKEIISWSIFFVILRKG